MLIRCQKCGAVAPSNATRCPKCNGIISKTQHEENDISHTEYERRIRDALNAIESNKRP